MKIGIPREVMTGEGRIALVPDACRLIIDAGHAIYIQRQAGVESGYADEEFSEVGATLVDSAKQLYDSTQLIVKSNNRLSRTCNICVRLIYYSATCISLLTLS
jgi:alanine dehydrogenase